MSAGAMHCMPLIVINMGGEMVYILEQRLFAQSVGNEKSKKVLQDVLRTMYSPKFIRELFKPQEMYSSSSTREIFNKLAHSSIMRLNESSMDKLYDLMTMGFKHQLLQCRYPCQMLHVTLNHLNILKNIGDSEQISVLIDAALKLVFETYGDMTAGDWLQLRQGLFAFVQGRKIKVSLFLQNNLQNLDGTFVLGNHAGPVALGAEVPGTIRYFDNEGRVDYDTAFDTPASEGCTPFQPHQHTPLGVNLYAKDLGKQINMSTMVPPACAADDVARAMALQLKHQAPLLPSAEAQARGSSSAARGASGGPSSSSSSGGGSSSSGGAKRTGGSNAAAELNLLAELMGAAAKSTADDDDEAAEEHRGGNSGHVHVISKPFKINLFPDDPFDYSDAGEGKVETVVLDATSQHKSAQGMMLDLRLDDDKAAGGPSCKASSGGAKEQEEEGDDLLDLMDAAK